MFPLIVTGLSRGYGTLLRTVTIRGNIPSFRLSGFRV